jgi:hypothetical protein
MSEEQANIDAFLKEMQELLQTHSPNVKIDQSKAHEIAASMALERAAIWKRLTTEPFLQAGAKPLFGFEFPRIPSPGEVYDNVKKEIERAAERAKRDACIVAHMAVAAALLAAWVSSGGTLIVGTQAAGVAITESLHAALVGGVTGGALAAHFC